MLTGSWGLRKKMDLRLLVSNMRYTQKKKKRARLFLYSTRDVTDSRWSQKPISLKNCNFWVLFSSYSFLLRTCFVCFNYILALRSFCLVGRAQHGAFRERRNWVKKNFFWYSIQNSVWVGAAQKKCMWSPVPVQMNAVATSCRCLERSYYN